MSLDFSEEPRRAFRRPPQTGSSAGLFAFILLVLAFAGGVAYFAYESMNRKIPPPEDFRDRLQTGELTPQDLGILAFSFSLYFCPSIIAILRRHNNFAPILVINALLGFVFIGWVVALAWALTDLRPRDNGRAS